ncbi:hypothetical protein BDZ85DRAFT_277286 [Elsinoe ampelina]|uniref:Uncharacterized protein n=1 Tax=Elsinoe ampelina TaxID=302913 RepID=A0A6A6GNQ4_9PEZI|nr:hypothetical protein BDZ85DRAFT_277286 [Elsinoe ampelina]
MSGVHGQIFGHLAKRGVELISTGGYSTTSEVHGKSVDNSPAENPAWGMIVIPLTVVLFLVVYASVKYTLGEVVASLAMIEQPKTLIVSELRPADDDSKNNVDAPLAKDRLLDEEVTIYREKPITASIRQTVRHLASVGGYTARWRGLSVSVVYHLLQAITGHAIAVLLSFIPKLGAVSFIIANILATVLLARIHMTWTHIMISNPSPLPWYRRIPHGRTYFKALITPSFIFAIAQYLTVLLPMMVYLSFGPMKSSAPDADGIRVVADPKHELFRLGATLATMAFVAIALLLPASVTLTRVEASLLPDDYETIVNFDRTLGGAAANLVGFGKINFRALYDAAWRSFDKPSRIRLIKFYVKYFCILFALVMMFTIVIGAEVATFGSSKFLLVVQGAHSTVESAARH